jgi:hypothetical protein
MGITFTGYPFVFLTLKVRHNPLDVPFTGKEFKDFHTLVSAKSGKGPTHNFESKYGNVYLRKSL